MLTKISGHLSWLHSIAECCEFVFLFFSEFMCMCWYTWSLLNYDQGRMGRDILLGQIPVGERSILDCSFLVQPGSIQTALSLNFVGYAYSHSYFRGRWQGEKQSWGEDHSPSLWCELSRTSLVRNAHPHFTDNWGTEKIRDFPSITRLSDLNSDLPNPKSLLILWQKTMAFVRTGDKYFIFS